MAFQDLLTVSARVKHVILLTDGQTQESGIPELVQAMRAEGITVSAVGLGSDVNRSLLQQAANLGGGRAYFTNDATNVPRIFVRETQTVGQNSAVEELVAIRAVEPADFLKGIHLGSAPMLRGYIATRPKPKPAQVVLESELAEPLLARWRVGLGWVLAWTSDVKSRWAADFVRWRELPSFFGQLVREHMRERRHDQLPMQTELDGDALLVSVDAIGPDDRFMNGLDSRLTVTGPLEAHGERSRAQRASRAARARPLRSARAARSLRLLRAARRARPGRSPGRAKRRAGQPSLPARVRSPAGRRAAARARGRAQRRRAPRRTGALVRSRTRAHRRARGALAQRSCCSRSCCS